MEAAELLKKVRKIEIKTRSLSKHIFAGEYHSAFKGRGIAFSEVREYQYGDDIRTIDWNVTARMNRPYVKVFEEERELTVMLMVDASSSGEFGTVNQMKGEIAIEICALLAFSAIKNNDKVGLIIFTDKVEKFVPPKKGKTHVLRVIRELFYHEPQSSKTDIGVALEYLNRIANRRSVVFLVSDFMSEGFEKALQIVNKKHDMVAITIRDPREISLPNVGFIELEDAETGEVFLLDTADPSIRENFSQQSTRKQEELEKLFKSMSVDHVAISTDRPYVDPLIRFFRMRAKRFH